MNNWIENYLTHEITYWEPSGSDLHGNPVWEKKTIKGRWEGRVERFTDSEGNERMSSAVVFVDRPLKFEGYLYKGSTEEEDPKNLNAARPVAQFIEIDSIDNLTTQYRAVLT